MSEEVSSVPLAPSGSIPPPPPPPMPGSKEAPKVQSYKEKREIEKAKESVQNGNSMESQQFANLPEKLLNTMKREKKPFTYTPLSVGDNGKLDLSQIKSPRMKKRLMANLRDDDENEQTQANPTEIDSIDQQLQSARVQPTSNSLLNPFADRQSRSITPQPTTNNNSYACPPLPKRQTSLVRDSSNGLSPSYQPPSLSTVDNWSIPVEHQPSVNSYSNSSWEDGNSNPLPVPSRNVYGRTPPPKVNIGNELWQERNPILTPSRSSPQSAADQLDSIWQPTPQPPPIWQSTPASASHQPTLSPSLPHPSSSSNLQVTRQVPMRVQFADDERSEPIQSKSFKLLQRMTSGIEDELQQLRLAQPQSQPVQPTHIPYNSNVEPPAYLGTLNHIEQPRVRGEVRIPVHVERRNNESDDWTRSQATNQSTFVSNNQMFPQSELESFAPLPPTRFEGAHIPSRSFRLLQMMTGEFDDFW